MSPQSPAPAASDRQRRRQRLVLVWLPVALLAAGTALLAATGSNEAAFRSWNAWASAWPAWFWSALSVLGNGAVLIALATWTLALRPRIVASLALLVVVAGAASIAMKRMFSVPRPAAVLGRDEIHVIGETLMHNSLPSGHALTAFAFAAVIAACARRTLPWRIATLAALLLAVGVSFSRVAVGAHWPLDAFFGGLVGWVCGLASVAWLRRTRAWRRVWMRRLLGVGAAVSALALLRTPLGYPLAEPLKLAAVVLGVLGLPIALAPRAAARGLRNGLRRLRGASPPDAASGAPDKAPR